MLKVSNISKTYKKGGERIQAVEDLSFNVSAGEVVGLLGNNGSGKTTTIKTICGLLKADSGQVLVNGHDVNKGLMKVLANIAIILEGNRNLNWRLTVEENCYYFGTLFQLSKEQIQQRMDTYLEYFDLVSKKKELVGNLSRGMQQKASLVIALLKKPKLLLLDEPFLGLDVSSRKKLLVQIKSMAKEENMGILVTSHQIDYVQEICDRVIILDQGKKILEDRIEDLLDTFTLNIYNIILSGFLTEEKVNRLKQVNSNIKIDCREGKVFVKAIIEDENKNMLWNILDQMSKLDLCLLDVECGRPELSYAYEQILKRRGEKYAI